MSNFFKSFAVLGFCVGAALPASATSIFTTGFDASGDTPTFSTDRAFSDAFEQYYGSGTQTSVAVAFTPTVDSTVTDVLVPVSQYTTVSSFSHAEYGNFYIIADLNGFPDTDVYGTMNHLPLYSGSLPNISALTGMTPTVYDVNLTGSATLTAGTKYWLLGQMPLGAASAHNEAVRWYQTTTTPYDTSYMWMYGNGSGWSSVSAAPLAFTLDNNAQAAPDAPEPASMALLGSGLFGLGIVARKRFRR